MLLHKENNQAGKNIFRLAALLCLVFLVYTPQNNQLQVTMDDEEHGIGGGIYLTDVYDTDADAEDTLIPDYNPETSVFEPTSFSNIRILLFDSHIVQRGENISTLAINFGLNQDTIISINKIANSRLLQIGRVLKIPNQDGIFHTVRTGETLDALATRYKVEKKDIKTVNELFSDRIVTGTDIFIPGARLEWTRLQEINGDLFIWPLNGFVTSGYGMRRDPFNPSRRHFHNGIDIRGRTGTPIRAAMAGRVSQVGWDRIFGNYVIINHHSGYRTLYAHMSVIRTRTGAYVVQGERIGDVGNTGLSTGPHLHFTIYKNGVTVNPRVLMR